MPAIVKSCSEGPEYFITSFNPSDSQPYAMGLNRSDAYEFTCNDLGGPHLRSFSDIASDVTDHYPGMKFEKEDLPRIYPKFISDALIGVWFIPKGGNPYAPEKLHVVGFENGKLTLRRDEPTDFIRLDINGVEMAIKQRFGNSLRGFAKITPYWASQ